MHLLHTVKNIQTQIHSSLNMTFTAGIPLCNIFRSHQNIIFKVMYTSYKFFLFCIVISNTIQKRYTGSPQSLCLKNINKAPAHYHGRHNQRSILRIDLHLLCQHILCLIHRILVTLHKFISGNDLILHLLLKDHIGDKISHKDNIFNISVLQIQTLKICQVITDKFLHQFIIMNGVFFQFLKALTNSQTSHFKALGSNQGILIKKRNLQASSSHIQNGSSLLDHFLKASFNGSN